MTSATRSGNDPSDRLGVMHDGRLMDVVDPAGVTEEQIGLLMAGESIDADATATAEEGPTATTGTDADVAADGGES
jgi:simple sugar transport system ATP-binding protein